MKKTMLLLLSVILAVCLLTACGDAQTTAETPTPEPSPSLTYDSDLVDSIASALDTQISDNFDYCKIDGDETGFTVRLATNGFADVAKILKASGYDENYKSWKEIRDTILLAYDKVLDFIEDYGIENPSVTFLILNDLNKDEALIKISDGKVVYDILAETETSLTTSTNTTSTTTATMGQKNALGSAKAYLSVAPISYEGLVEQLEFDKYSHDEAVYAADNCGADWNEQAAKAAKNYLSITSFSRAGLIEQLEFDGYTHNQAVYGAEANGY